MQYSREDAEMQPQHDNNAGGLFTECNEWTQKEKRARVKISREFVSF